MAIAASSTTTGLVYAASEAGLFRSNDAGLTWQRLPVNQQFMLIAVSPTNDKLLAGVDRCRCNRARGQQRQASGTPVQCILRSILLSRGSVPFVACRWCQHAPTARSS